MGMACWQHMEVGVLALPAPPLKPLPDIEPAPVTSEVETLRRAIVHRPGPELERLTPGNRATLLFDDVPWLERAQAEHDAFTSVLTAHGVECLDLRALLAGALQAEPAQAMVLRATLAAADLGPGLLADVTQWLGDLPPWELADRCIDGISFADLPFASGSLPARTARPADFVVPPLPNSYFTRDPATWVGRGVVLSAMAHRVRRREVVHLEAIVRHHPMVRETAPRVWREDRDSGGSLEGGDLLVVGDGILVAGCGGRSGAGTVERLAAELFAAGAAKEVVAVVLPDRRSEMHLDSVFSQVDRDAFVVYADLVHRVDTYALRPGAGGRVLVDPQDHLPGAVARALGLPGLRLFDTGDDALTSEREHWAHASNVLALSPGQVVTYERNVRSAERLRETGIEVITVPGSELGRGRGGPRCMVAPLARGVPPEGVQAP
jgi:arginine deiminase